MDTAPPGTWSYYARPPVPLPTLLCLVFATGLSSALAGRVELPVSPRPALLTTHSEAFAVFAALVAIPIGCYFYVFHGDWFLLYTIDVRRIPSALALVGFVVLGGIGALGFAVGASMVRGQRDTLGGALVGLSALAGIAVILVAKDRLALVGTFGQYEGGFGLHSFGTGPLVQGTIVMSAILFVGIVFLLYRLLLSGRRVS